MAYPGDISPLIIYLEYLEDGRSLEQKQFNVFPEQSREWEWRGYRFILGEYEYGEWMEVRRVSVRYSMIVSHPNVARISSTPPLASSSQVSGQNSTCVWVSSTQCQPAPDEQSSSMGISSSSK